MIVLRWLCVIGIALAASGCKSEEAKCAEKGEEHFKEEVAKCKDDACKADALKYKSTYVDECVKRSK